MEFDGLYISEEPAEDDIRTRWDKLVISTKCVRHCDPRHLPLGDA